MYASGEEIRSGAHVFCHNRADGKAGKAYLVINTSWTESTTVELPKLTGVPATGKVEVAPGGCTFIVL